MEGERERQREKGRDLLSCPLLSGSLGPAALFVPFREAPRGPPPSLVAQTPLDGHLWAQALRGPAWLAAGTEPQASCADCKQHPLPWPEAPALVAAELTHITKPLRTLSCLRAEPGWVEPWFSLFRKQFTQELSIYQAYPKTSPLWSLAAVLGGCYYLILVYG